MKVAWDARVLFHPRLRGIGNYGQWLLDAIHRLRADIQVTLFHEPSDVVRDFSGFPSQAIGPVRGHRWQLWEQIGLPWAAYRAGADVLHSIANTTPPRALTPRVVSLLDVIPHLPNVPGERPALSYFRRTVPKAMQRVEAILTVSERSKQDIVEHFGVKPERITVVPAAANPRLQPLARPARSLLVQKAGISRPFVLALAAREPRKNTAGTIRTFARVARRVPDPVLVLFGILPDLERLIWTAADEASLPRERIVMLPFVDEDLLAALYGEALLFFFPSLYEGFGLPILEAMRCGTVVVTSNRGACPEVAGDAAFIIDPGDEEAASEVIVRALGQSQEEREAWRQRGFARDRRFTWDATARGTIAVYEAVAS
jgi:alpha-1,3-rhamnosyl/mannosyltransferase